MYCCDWVVVLYQDHFDKSESSYFIPAFSQFHYREESLFSNAKCLEGAAIWSEPEIYLLSFLLLATINFRTIQMHVLITFHLDKIRWFITISPTLWIIPPILIIFSPLFCCYESCPSSDSPVSTCCFSSVSHCKYFHGWQLSINRSYSNSHRSLAYRDYDLFIEAERTLERADLQLIVWSLNNDIWSLNLGILFDLNLRFFLLTLSRCLKGSARSRSAVDISIRCRWSLNIEVDLWSRQG